MEFKFILILFFILSAILNELRKYFTYKKLVGKKLLFVYQESETHSIQKISGVVIKKIKVGSGTHFIVNLMEPIAYSDKNSNAIIIKEKNGKPPIGYQLHTEIHIYLPLVNLNNNQFSLSNFEHIGWGRAEKHP